MPSVPVVPAAVELAAAYRNLPGVGRRKVDIRGFDAIGQCDLQTCGFRDRRSFDASIGIKIVGRDTFFFGYRHFTTLPMAETSLSSSYWLSSAAAQLQGRSFVLFGPPQTEKIFYGIHYTCSLRLFIFLSMPPALLLFNIDETAVLNPENGTVG